MMALWLAAILGEPAALHHHCPMHDGPVPAAAGAHGSHSGQHVPAPDHGKHGCTCVGTCSSGGTTAVTVTPPAVTASIRWRATVTRHEQHSVPLPRRAFALPFANGPPVSLRA